MTSTRIPVVRITETSHEILRPGDPRPVIVSVHGDKIFLRQKGLRDTFEISIDHVFREAVALRASKLELKPE